MERVTVSATNTTNGSILTVNQHNPQLPFSTTTTATISLHHKPAFPSFPPPKRHHLHQQRPTNTPDTELSIFSAERYFKEDDLHKEIPTLLPPSPLKKSQPTTTTILPLHYPRTHSSTTHRLPISAITTASSEASWNSQAGLLPPHPPASSSSSAATPGRSPRWRFRYQPSCPCSGKRSVDVEEKFAEFKSSYLSSSTYGSSSATFTPAMHTIVDDPPPRITVDDRDVGFLVSGMARLEILPSKWEKPEEAFSLHDDKNNNNNNAFSFPILAKPTTAAAEEEELPRDSLEVFRPRESGCSPSAVTPRRRSADLLGRWALRHPPTEEMRRSFTFSESPRRPREDDLASDASSDLFEIESFSTSTAPPPPSAAPASRQRESMDEPELGGAGYEPARPSACYPPSEVSVQWSVTTAEGYASLANFSSAASECGGPAAEREAVGGGGVAGRKKAGGGGGGGGLLMMSCRSTKAVDVATPVTRQVVEGRTSGLERPALTPSLSARANRPVHGV